MGKGIQNVNDTKKGRHNKCVHISEKRKCKEKKMAFYMDFE